MRQIIIVFAFIMALMVFICALACATKDSVEMLFCLEKPLYYTKLLSVLVSLGTLSATLFVALYGVIEYENHKAEQRIKLLCEYNQRYSTDRNIESVVTWMLKIAQVDRDGKIVGANPDRTFICRPEVHQKEMFMRFFEELYLHIKSGNIKREDACKLFSYYAIEFDKHEGFRFDITDYKSSKQLDDMEEGEAKKYSLYWSNYRCFVDDMKKEWDIIKQRSV